MFENIISKVPQGEHFDASAINEGVWLSIAHLNNVEQSLAENADAFKAVADDRDAQALAAQQANEELIAANASHAANAETITALQNEIAELKKGPAGTFTNTTKDADDLGGSGKSKFHTSVDDEAARMRAMRNKK